MTRLMLIPMLAVLALAAAPALAQYQGRMPPQTPQSAAPISQPAPVPDAANPAPTGTLAPAAAAAAAPNPGLPVISAPNCAPPEYPGALASNTRIRSFNTEYKAYGDCIKKYVEGNKAWVNAVIESNNKAVEDYNKYTADLKKLIDANQE